MKLPPSPMKALTLRSRTPSQASTVLRPVRARGREIVLLGQSIERNQFRFLGDADCALALHVRMAAHRKDAGTRFADIAAQEQQIAQHLNGEHAGAMLRQPHAVTGDDGIRVCVDLGRGGYCAPRQSRARLDVAPVEQVHRGCEFFEAAGVLFDETDIEDARAAVIVFASSSMSSNAFDMPTNAAEISARIELMILRADLRLGERQHLRAAIADW